MSRSDNLRDVKDKALERIALGAALATLAGYIVLAIDILRRDRPRR
ncbi:MAG: hypothetical protein ACYDCO_26485 [Armatimonadota bacterium]